MLNKIGTPRSDLYLNPIAQLYLMAKQLTKVLIAGRGFGKSFLNGISIMIKVFFIPRSRGIFLGATYTQILTNTLLPMKSAWAWFGYQENIHYVIGKKPPEFFKQPFQQPEKFENVITWWNGTTIILGSMDRPQLLRGGNNDWLIVDEALLIDQEPLNQIVDKSIRGSHPIFKGKPGHCGREFTSSMPYGTKGMWLLDMEAHSKNPDNDTFYIEGTSWHNRKVLGDKILRKWEREAMLSEKHRIDYMIEVLNKKVRMHANTFYPALSKKHWYIDTYNYEHIDKLGLNLSKKKRDCRWDKDMVSTLPINISHDWGAFNAITIDQHLTSLNEVRFINVMYVKHPKIIDDLANEFHEYYKYHTNKTVYQYGDKSGAKKEANVKLTYFEQFASILRAQGWTVIRKKVGDIGHLERHKFINRLHREQDARLPRIRHNANNCDDLRTALESTPMKDEKKDKSSERNENIKPEHATHLTDAYDYRLFHAYHRLVAAPAYKSPVEVR